MRIIGVDPGTRYVGYGIIELKGNQLKPITYGTIFANEKEEIEKRLALIHNTITNIIGEFSPNEGAIEKAFVGKNPHSALRIGEGRGTVISAMGLAKLPVMEYTPLMVKKAVVGNHFASKEQVRLMVRVILSCKEPFATDDTSDALAVAICHSHRQKLNLLLPSK